MAKRNNPPTDYSCSLHCYAGGLISSVHVLYGSFYFIFWMHFHKAVLRRTLCTGSWMYFEKETPLQRTLSLNCKDGWSKNEGWLFCFLQMGAEAGEVTVVAKVTLGVPGIASWSLKCSSSILPYLVLCSLAAECGFDMHMCNEPSMFCICLAKLWPQGHEGNAPWLGSSRDCRAALAFPLCHQSLVF